MGIIVPAELRCAPTAVTTSAELGGVGLPLADEPQKLFAAGVRIGRDYIASTIYTIVFATAGGFHSSAAAAPSR